MSHGELKTDDDINRAALDLLQFLDGLSIAQVHVVLDRAKELANGSQIFNARSITIIGWLEALSEPSTSEPG